MEAEEVSQALIRGELKKSKSVANHTPRQDGSGRIGVSTACLHMWLKRNTIELERILIDGVLFFFIPREDQLKPDWGIGAKYKKRRRGPKTTREILGFD